MKSIIYKIEFYFFVSILILISSIHGQRTLLNGTIMFDLERSINGDLLHTAFQWYKRQTSLYTGVSDGRLDFNDFPKPSLNATQEVLQKMKEDIQQNRTLLTFGTGTYFGDKLTRLNISTPTAYFMNYFPIFNFPLSMHIAIVEELYTYIDTFYDNSKAKTLIILNSDVVDHLKPWERVDVLDPLLRNISGSKYFMFYQNNEHEIILKIRNVKIDNIILMVDSSAARKILKAAYLANLLKWQRRWLIYLPISSDLNIFGLDIDEHSTNITTVQFADVDRNSALVLNDSLSCATFDSLVIGLQILNKVLLNQTTGIIPVQGKTGNFTIDISKLNAFPRTAAVVRDSWVMYIYQGLGFHTIKAGNITGVPSSTGMTWNFPEYSKLNPSAINVKEPFTHATFRIVTMIEDPFVKFKSDASKYPEMKDKLEGLVIDIVKALMKSVNISYTIILVPTNVYGTLQSDGQWNGLFEHVVNGKAEMAAALFSMTTERAKAADFLTSFLTVRGSVLYKETVASTLAVMFQFYFPFDLITWTAIGGTAIVVIIILTIIHCISPNKIKLGLSETAFFAFGSLTMGHIPMFPNRHSSTVIICFWWLFALMVFLIYTSNWSAYRLKTSGNDKIDGLSSLPNLVNYQYGTVKGSIYENMLLSASEGYLRRINKMVRHQFVNGLVDNSSRAVELVAQGNYAFIWDSSITRYYAYKNCWKSVGEFDKFPLAFAVPLFSDYKDLLNEHLTMLKAKGNITLINEKYTFMTDSPNKKCGFGENIILNALYALEFRLIAQYFSDGALRLEQSFGIFIIIVSSCALVLILAFIEAGIRLYCRKLVDKRGDGIKTKKESRA